MSDHSALTTARILLPFIVPLPSLSEQATPSCLKVSAAVRAHTMTHSRQDTVGTGKTAESRSLFYDLHFPPLSWYKKFSGPVLLIVAHGALSAKGCVLVYTQSRDRPRNPPVDRPHTTFSVPESHFCMSVCKISFPGCSLFFSEGSHIM